MTAEDEEFNRIEREAKARMLAVRYAMEMQRLRDDMPDAIPFVTAEDWAKLKEQE
jgi:hypothetical protein